MHCVPYTHRIEDVKRRALYFVTVTKRSEILGIIFDRAQSVHFLTFRFFFFFLTFMKLSNYLNLNKIDTIAKGCMVNIVKFLRTRLGGHNPFKLNVLH